ncbi:MAG: SHOCT domain-containing protein [Flavobacteriales bacterium]
MRTPFTEVKKKYKLSFYVEDSITLNDGSMLTIGSAISLGESTSKISNQYETIYVGGFSTITANALTGSPNVMATTDKKQISYVINKIRCSRQGGRVIFAMELKDTNSTSIVKMGKLLVITNNSFERKEVINPNAPMTSNEALEELKRAKSKLDLGLITEEEFNKIRKKLAKLIK